MAEAKHAFVDDYPYLVYTAEQGTLVYSDKADTSINDIPGGGDGQEYNIYCFNAVDQDPVQVGTFAYAATIVNNQGAYSFDIDTSETINKAEAGTFVAFDVTDFTSETITALNSVYVTGDIGDFIKFYPSYGGDETAMYFVYTMPKQDLYAYLNSWQ